MATPKEISPTNGVAAFLSTVGSPQFDAFEGGGFLEFVNAVSNSRAVATQQDATKCGCSGVKGCGDGTATNPCGLCKSTSNQPLPCFCWLVVSTTTAAGGLQANTPFYTCAPNSANAIIYYNGNKKNPRNKWGRDLRDRDWYADDQNVRKS